MAENHFREEPTEVPATIDRPNVDDNSLDWQRAGGTPGEPAPGEKPPAQEPHTPRREGGTPGEPAPGEKPPAQEPHTPRREGGTHA